MTPEQLAVRFHETYERLAPSHGYETRKESAKPWADVPENNKALMIAVCGEILASHNQLTFQELTERFYAIKEQRDKLMAFCRIVCPSAGPATFNKWDHQIGNLYVELRHKDRKRLLDLLDESASYCPVHIQDKIRKLVAEQAKNVHPSRLLEALKAIADHEHCLAAFTVQGLRNIASAALQEIDPKNDYSSCVGPEKPERPVAYDDGSVGV